MSFTFMFAFIMLGFTAKPMLKNRKLKLWPERKLEAQTNTQSVTFSTGGVAATELKFCVSDTHKWQSQNMVIHDNNGTAHMEFGVS